MNVNAYIQEIYNMGQRRDRLNKRLARAEVTRRVNSQIKDAERLRRKQAMLTIIKKGKLPYTPTVMSWLSDQLGKKSSKITPQDVKTLISLIYNLNKSTLSKDSTALCPTLADC